MINPNIKYKSILEKLIPWIILSIILILTAYIRYRLISIPLERDEGCYAYIGQHLLRGQFPYSFAYHQKFPGIYLAYSLMIAIFGNSLQGIHIGLLFTNLFTIIAIYLLAKLITNEVGALVSASSFAILSISNSVSGIIAQPEHFIVLFTVCGLFTLLVGLDKKSIRWIFTSGLLLGIALFMKQSAIAFLLFANIYILFELAKRLKSTALSTLIKMLLMFWLGTASVIAFVVFIFAYVGILTEFYLWTIIYPSIYVSLIPINFAWENFARNAIEVFKTAPLFWWFICIGIIYAISVVLLKLVNQLKSFFRGKTEKQFSKKISPDKKTKDFTFFIIIFAFFSVLAICPGFYFRPHYFFLLIPCASLLAGMAVLYLSRIIALISSRSQLKYGIPILMFLVCFAQSIYLQNNYLFYMTPNQICKIKYGTNPFIESIKIAKFIKQHTSPKDYVAILGSEPQILFYADRLSATPYMLMYPLTLAPNNGLTIIMQQDFIESIEKKEPKYIVFVHVYTSWLLRDNKNFIISWLDIYTKKHYRLTGIVKIFRTKTTYNWNPKNKILPSKNSSWIAIFERKI